MIMGIEKVKAYFKQYEMEDQIMEFETSSATVALAAEAIGCAADKIAKTLAFKKDEGCVLVVAAGEARVDNRKFKETFMTKAKMLSPDEVLHFTGHEVGGVCPFAIEHEGVKVYIDVSLKAYEKVYPACGSSDSAIELTVDELHTYGKALDFVDVCK